MDVSTTLALFVGIGSHIAVFNRDEWHLRAPEVFIFHILAASGITATVMRCSTSPTLAITHSSTLCVAYLAGLFGSICIYRMYFHRLKRFPGPRLAAVSKLWHVWACRDSRNHLVLDSLHQQYGTFVRTGPSEITVFHSEAFEAMDGPGSNTTRSDWYDLLYPRVSSVFTRDRALHERRRSIWLNSLSSKALPLYEPRVVQKANNLTKQILKASGAPILVNDLMRWFSFDLMGDFAFSFDFGMMEQQEYNTAISQLRSAITLLGPFSHAIWLPRLAFAFIPGLWKVRDWFEMLAFCDRLMDSRMQKSSSSPDIASHFITAAENSAAGADQSRWLSGDTATVVVAGSDTTAPTLINLFYLLARHPRSVQKIHAELESVDMSDTRAITALPHLNGAINEAMRLLPAVLTFVTRVSPPKGMCIGGTYIPGNIKISAPRYSIGRLESAWERPLDFVPERWYSHRHMIKDRRAFAPFGVGKTSCVGKALALSEIRLATAYILSKFSIGFVPGDNGEAVERDMRDQLTSNPGDLYLRFEPRM